MFSMILVLFCSNDNEAAIIATAHLDYMWTENVLVCLTSESVYLTIIFSSPLERSKFLQIFFTTISYV